MQLLPAFQLFRCRGQLSFSSLGLGLGIQLYAGLLLQVGVDLRLWLLQRWLGSFVF